MEIIDINNCLDRKFLDEIDSDSDRVAIIYRFFCMSDERRRSIIDCSAVTHPSKTEELKFWQVRLADLLSGKICMSTLFPYGDDVIFPLDNALCRYYDEHVTQTTVPPWFSGVKARLANVFALPFRPQA